MSVEQPSRRLAAILVADVAGYSALMGADEAGTVAALKAHQAVVLPMISAQGGRVIDTAGDGILAEFGSVVAAVHCAIALQAAMAERNRDVPPERRMAFRIGINQGDVVYDDARIYGDGINVAARLQALAEPGGILISGKVFEEVRDRVETTFRDLGVQMLKNIARPVRAFAVGGGDPPRGHRGTTMMPSLAVLPFKNLSGDPEQDYFADGFVEDITTALSRFRQFSVVARASTLAYKAQTVDVRHAGRELGVRYVLEGSVRRNGDRLRVTAQLADAEAGVQLWAEKFDGMAADIFDMQDRLTERVVGIVEPRVVQAEIEHSRRKRPESLDAYDLYLQALPGVYLIHPDTNARSRELLDRAVELDPGFAQAVALAGVSYMARYAMHFAGASQADADRGMELAKMALSLGSDDATVMSYCGYMHIALGREYDTGVSLLRRAVEANPNNATVLTEAGIGFIHGGDLDEAADCLQRALMLNPNDFGTAWQLSGMAHVRMAQRRFEEALDWATRSQGVNPAYDANHWMLIAANAHLGRMEAARRWRHALQVLRPDASLARIRRGQHPQDPWRVDVLIDGMRLAGLPEDSPTPAVLPSLAVLPFQNLSGDTEQEYFADGVVEDMITALSRFKSFAVVSRNSSFVYKGRAADVREVGRHLGARYVLEGSVQKSGATLRITAQLVDATSGATLWAQNFDGALADVFAFQDGITERVASIVEPMLKRAELDRLRVKPPNSLGAYDLYLQALAIVYQPEAENNRRAGELIERALALDPKFAPALGVAASTHIGRWDRQLPGHTDADRRKGLAYAHAALAAAEDDAQVRAVAGLAVMTLGDEFDTGMIALRQAASENPNSVPVLTHAAIGAIRAGELDEAERFMLRAIGLNQLDFGGQWALGGMAHIRMAQGRYQEAVDWATRAHAASRHNHSVHWMLAAGNAHLGRLAEAVRWREALQALLPDTTIASIRRGQPMRDPHRIEVILDGLRIAGLPEG